MKSFIQEIDKSIHLLFNITFLKGNRITYPNTNDLIISLDKIKNLINKNLINTIHEFESEAYKDIEKKNLNIDEDQIIRYINTQSPEIEILIEIGLILFSHLIDYFRRNYRSIKERLKNIKDHITNSIKERISRADFKQEKVGYDKEIRVEVESFNEPVEFGLELSRSYKYDQIYIHKNEEKYFPKPPFSILILTTETKFESQIYEDKMEKISKNVNRIKKIHPELKIGDEIRLTRVNYDTYFLH